MNKTEFNLLNPALQIVELMSVIYRKGLTTASGGNISIRTASGDIFITPALIDKGNLNEDDICCILENGNIIGKHLPSSELNFHEEIYNVSPSINCIIHAHPPSLVACSISNYIPDNYLFFSTAKKCDIPGFAKYDIPGSKKLAKNISVLFKIGKYSVIMENHGAVVGGENPLEALIKFEAFEHLANVDFLSKKLSNQNQVKEIYREHKFNFSIPNSKLNKYNKSTEISNNLCYYLRRLYEKNYLLNSNGTVSIRKNKTQYLINSTNKPYWQYSSSELILTNISSQKNGEIFPYDSIHNSIYDNNPDINSIIIAQPPNLISFAISGIIPEIKTIPESWIFLKTTAYVSFKDFMDKKTIISNLIKNHSLIIIGNMAVISSGRNILEAFNRIEVAEFNAKSILSGIDTKNINILNKDQINNLNNKYFNG